MDGLAAPAASSTARLIRMSASGCLRSAVTATATVQAGDDSVALPQCRFELNSTDAAYFANVRFLKGGRNNMIT